MKRLIRIRRGGSRPATPLIRRGSRVFFLTTALIVSAAVVAVALPGSPLRQGLRRGEETITTLRTMKLILGLRPLTQFDAEAAPMANSFTSHSNFTPYDAIEPAQSLTEMNSPSDTLAAESARMDFSREDLAPWRLLNEAIWKSVKGAGSEMPEPFLSIDVTDDDA